jgi:hypothetical protein
LDGSYTTGFLKKERDRIEERMEKFLMEIDEIDAVEQDIDISGISYAP